MARRSPSRAWVGGRQQYPEYRARRYPLPVVFDDAAMVADQLGDQRQAEPGTAWARADERIEHVISNHGRRAGAIVDHADFQW